MMKGEKIFGLTLGLAVLMFIPLNVKASTKLYYTEEYDFDCSDTWNWVENAAHWAHAEEIALGTPSGEFMPDKPITRAEAVAMLVRFMELDTKVYEGDCEYFNDVNGAWYTSCINAAYENSLVAGKGNGIFDPEAVLTRAEATKLIVAAAGCKIQQDAETSFGDIEGQWYTDYIKTAFNNKLINGKSATFFDPESATTRAEFVQMLYNVATKDYQQGDYFAIRIPDECESFVLNGSDGTVLSYDAGTHAVSGEAKVERKEGYLLAKFTPTGTLEFVLDSGRLTRVWVYSVGRDLSLSGRNTSRITLDPDGNITMYRKEDEPGIFEASFNISGGAFERVVSAEGDVATYDIFRKYLQGGYRGEIHEGGTRISGGWVNHSHSEYFTIEPGLSRFLMISGHP